ncbi:hypothetical protein LUZ60_008726 [Juncus effusus]|nr:hypothetical protein LUZ60_008726 [Juncus effusus]
MVRSFKLREAHKTGNNGAASVCSIVWSHDGSHVATSSASDTAVMIHDLSAAAPPAGRSAGVNSPVVLRHHKEEVTALALAPSPGGTLASGSVDHSVKLYSFPKGQFQSNVTRFTLPIRSLAFNKTGSLLAAGGDDDGIKLISTVDSTISKVLKGHKGSITSLSFDPQNEYLASIDSLGTVIFWELSTGKILHTLKSIAPNCNSENSVLNMLSWRPDGEMLAVPGLRNDVVFYDRDTSEKLFNLRGDHEKSICCLSWSPNGKYLATSGLDKQVLIWDVDLKQDIEREKFEERICGLDWKPNGNCLAVIDCVGKFGIWENPVPVSMKSPIEGGPVPKPRLFESDNEEENDEISYRNNISESLNDSLDGNNGDLTPISYKKGKRKGRLVEEGEEEEEDLLHEIESRKRRRERDNARKLEREERESGDSFRERKVNRMQEPFQAGSTPAQEAGKRRFLCYNLLGCVTSLQNDDFSHIEVDFHDTGKGPRVPAMNDRFGFTMAALNESGCVLGNPCKGEKNMSTLLYRPFSSWANNSEWSMRFEGEEVKAVAVGKGWVACVTSLNFLRIFTQAGLQRHILSVNGPVVTLAGFGDLLAIVTHSSDCLPSGDQVLEIKVFNINEARETLNGRLALTPASRLTWFGFSEDGQLSSFDSTGILRVYCDQFGGNWLPVFSAAKAKKSEDENYWIVGLNASKLFCIICKSPETYPPVMPKPVLTILDLSFPIASSDLGADELENEFIMTNLRLSEVRKKREEAESVGRDDITLDREVFYLEASLDRCILKLIGNCCHSDKLVRATELARLLNTEKSLKGAIKIVTALKLPILQEKFSSILEERMLNDIKTTETTPTPIIRHTNITPNSIETPIRSAQSIKSFSNADKTPNSIQQPIKSLKPNTEKETSNADKTPNSVQQPIRSLKPHSTTPQEKNTEKEILNERKSGNSEVALNGSKFENGKVGELKRPVNPFARAKKA